MKKTVKKWILLLVLSGLIFLLLFIGIILKPSLSYAHQTQIGNCRVYHTMPIDSFLKIRLLDASKIVRGSELHEDDFQFDVCLDDGSWYPSLIKTIFSDPFGATFYNKIVFWGAISFRENYGLEGLNKWNITQFIAHVQTHCLQFHRMGLWKSNPLAGYPAWKWEGYAEYIARKYQDKPDLAVRMGKLIQTENNGGKNWIEFPDGTGSSLVFYRRMLLVEYCSDIKKMTFETLLKDTCSEKSITNDLMNWYNRKSAAENSAVSFQSPQK